MNTIRSISKWTKALLLTVLCCSAASTSLQASPASQAPVPVASATNSDTAENSDSELPLFAPTLYWNNAGSAQDFPIHWVAASNQGTLLAGSQFSRNFLAYNIYTGECKGRQTLPFPSGQAPALDGLSAVFCDMSTAVTAYNSETCEETWQRLPLGAARHKKNLRQPIPRPRICKARPIVYENKIVTMNTDGLTIFYPNSSPDGDARPDYLFLQTSLDEKGTFTNTPIINRQVFYACTSRGHLHYANLNNLNEVGMIKNITDGSTDTIAREVRVPLIASSRFLYLATMDGTVHCYQPLRKYAAGATKAPQLVWRKKLQGKHRFQSNSLGYPISALIYDNEYDAIFTNTKDYAQALDDSTGEIIWSHHVPQGIATAPLRWSKYLLLISEALNEQPAQLLALDPETGHTMATMDLPSVPSCPPLLWNDYLIIGYTNGYAECYRLAVTNS